MLACPRLSSAHAFGAAHRIYLSSGGGPLQRVGELSGAANIFSPSAALVPGSVYSWRVEAVSASGEVASSPVWNFSVGCEDLDCAACGTSPHLGSCVACDAGRELVDGRCAYAGGCLEGSWQVTAIGSMTTVGQASKCDRSSVPHICGPLATPGLIDEVFVMEERPSTFCNDNYDGAGLWWVQQVSTGAYLENLGCAARDESGAFLNNYTLSASFSCVACEPGYVTDDGSSSGCSPDALPPPPPTPQPTSAPTPSPSAAPTLAPPTVAPTLATAAECVPCSKDRTVLFGISMMHFDDGWPCCGDGDVSF